MHVEVGVQRGADRGDQSHRGHRIPAQVEKRVVDADPVEPEDLCVDAGQDLFDGVGRGAIVFGVLVFRHRQGAGIEFPVDRQGECRQHHDRRGHHVTRQPLGQRGTHGGRVGGPGDVADQPFVAGAVFARDDRGPVDAVQCGQGGLDLAEFDAVTTDLDLLVGATQIVQLPIGAPPHQIPGAIHPRPRSAEGTGNEP
ncbi:hypothetical protein GCM10023161_45110 [Mycobacterium paraffinicum]|uniref:Uncharacterized protein n=1 Tax=Mycobacterium paraffinicum TaxID=53378 RepID=A0ABP8F4U3_9MYCO